MEQFTLSNGLQVIVNPMPHLRSVSMGVWVRAGSVLEKPRENGLSHFMEHMAFKGTPTRTSRQIAEEMDAVGGHLNASTSKLCTNYYAKVIDEDLPLAADILADITRNPTLDEGEFEKERGVILEEISMVEDSPEDVVYDVLSSAVFGDQPHGQTILGPADNISAYTVADIRAYRNKHYGPENAVIALAGNVTAEAAQALLEVKFGDWQGAKGEKFPIAVANLTPQVLTREKDTEQMHICLSYRGYEMGSKKVYASATLNNILGGGMSSRLFQRIREELGMAYTVYSSPSTYPSCGEYVIYAAVAPRNTAKVLEQIDLEINKLLSDGVTDKEFTQAKAQLKGSFILGLESAYNRMSSMGHNLTLLGRNIPPEETISGIEQVTMDEVLQVAKEVLTAPRSFALVGKKPEQYVKYISV